MKSKQGSAAAIKKGAKRTTYTQRRDCEGFEVPNGKPHKLACCDCGLVHQVVIVAPGVRKGASLGVAVRRDNRATGQRRRYAPPSNSVPVAMKRLHALGALPEDIALIREQNPLQRELHDGRPVVGWPKWAKDNLRSVIRYRVAITGGDVSAWEPRMG